jgi:hypothetical protein
METKPAKSPQVVAMDEIVDSRQSTVDRGLVLILVTRLDGPLFEAGAA